MKIETLRVRIVRVAYHQEEGDPHYGSCLWAYYDFDVDRYMLNIQSDCGNAAYRWTETPESESFLHLMGRIGDDYLLHKLFDDDTVDVKATLRTVREYLGIGEDEDEQDEDLTDEEREEREEAVQELERLLEDAGCPDLGSAQYLLEAWNDDHDLELDCPWELVQTDFSANQKRIVQIFADHVQPVIRKMVREGRELEYFETQDADRGGADDGQ